MERGRVGLGVAVLVGAAALTLSCRQAATLLVKQALRSPCLLASEEVALEVDVVDGQGGGVPDAAVRLSDESGRTLEGKTGQGGTAAFWPASRGPYVAEVTRAGYVPLRVTGLSADGGCSRYTVALVLSDAATESGDAGDAEGRRTGR